MPTKGTEIAKQTEGIAAQLEALIALSKRSSLDRVRAALNAANFDQEEFFRLVPREVVGLALALTFPPSKKDLREKLGDAYESKLEKAVDLLEDELSFIIADQRVLNAFTGDMGGREIPGPREVFKTVIHVQAVGANRFVKADQEVSFVPAVRLVFFGEDGPLLDSLMDWDDLSKVLGRLAVILGEEVRLAAGLVDFLPLRLMDSEVEVMRESLKIAVSELQGISESFEQILAVGPANVREAESTTSTRRPSAAKAEI